MKLRFIFFVFVWMRGTLPRLRYDQLMNLGWKIMFPLALLNLMVTACVIAGMDEGFLRNLVLFVLGAGIILIVDQLIVRYRRKTLHAA